MKTRQHTKRSNKIDNADLFTAAATENYLKHIKTHSKQTLSVIQKTIDWLNKYEQKKHLSRKYIFDTQKTAIYGQKKK